jgi:hypothetical protein
MKNMQNPPSTRQLHLEQGFPSSHIPCFTKLQKGLVATTWVLIVLAFMGSILLLLEDALLPFFAQVPHATVSATPLLLIGVASLGFQGLLRPKRLDFLKTMLASLAFLLWGIDQLLLPGWGTTSLGDLVIVLYVVDLGWMMVGILRARYHEREKQESDGREAPHTPDMQTEPTLTRI